MTEEEDYSAQRNFLGVALAVILDARRTCRYPYVDSHSSLRKYYQILPFGERQVLPFQNYKTSTTYYTYVYGFGFFSSRRNVPEKKYYYVKTSAHDRTWYYCLSSGHERQKEHLGSRAGQRRPRSVGSVITPAPLPAAARQKLKSS